MRAVAITVGALAVVSVAWGARLPEDELKGQVIVSDAELPPPDASPRYVAGLKALAKKNVTFTSDGRVLLHTAGFFAKPTTDDKLVFVIYTADAQRKQIAMIEVAVKKGERVAFHKVSLDRNDVRPGRYVISFESAKRAMLAVGVVDLK